MTDLGSDNLRDELLELLMSSQHAPRDTHHGETGECLQCPWPLHALPPDDIADVLTAEVERRVAEAKAEAWDEGASAALIGEGYSVITAAAVYDANPYRALASGQEGN